MVGGMWSYNTYIIWINIAWMLFKKYRMGNELIKSVADWSQKIIWWK